MRKITISHIMQEHEWLRNRGNLQKNSKWDRKIMVWFARKIARKTIPKFCYRCSSCSTLLAFFCGFICNMNLKFLWTFYCFCKRLQKNVLLAYLECLRSKELREFFMVYYASVEASKKSSVSCLVVCISKAIFSLIRLMFYWNSVALPPSERVAGNAFECNWVLWSASRICSCLILCAVSDMLYITAL